MVEEQMVSGDGWVSDDSSFYGDEVEQEYQQSLCESFNSRAFWTTHHRDLNTTTKVVRAQRADDVPTKKVFSTEGSLPSTATTPSASSVTARNPFDISGLDRKTMEQERLARLGGPKREASPEPSPQLELFNIREGCADAWQLGESVDGFVKRLSPVSTSLFNCPWIWVSNPYRNPRDKSAVPRIEHFTSRGTDLLEQSLQNREEIQVKVSQGPKGVLTKLLNQESKELQQRIADLAVEDHVLSGKWMLFPKSADVTRVWKHVVQGVIDNRLGPTAKVATDDGNDERLICVYTRDFQDVDDVLRVLQELETMGLLNSGRTIYYKSDAYTYLDLKGGTVAQYGLQASLYNSRTMMAAGRVPKSTSLPQKKQSTLNRFF